MRVHDYIVSLFVCFMLTYSPYKAYADTWGFQPNQVSVRPLYTITHEDKQPQHRIGAYTAPMYSTAPTIAVRPYSGMQSMAYNYHIHAWKGSLSGIGAVAPQGASVTIETSGRTMRRAFPDELEPFPDPIGDTPYWLFAVLLVGYCCWRRKKNAAL